MERNGRPPKERHVSYETDAKVCTKDCPYNPGVKVGSCRCNDCPRFIRKHMDGRKYVVCKIALDSE